VSVERSPVDLLRLVVAAVALLSLLLLSWLAGDTLVPFAADLLRGLDAVPTRLLDLVVVVTRVLTAAVLVGGLAWTAVRNGWRAVLTIGAAAALGAVLVPLLGDLAGVDDGAVVAVPDIALGPLTSGWFPTAAGIAALAAALTAAAPWLGRRWRRAGWTAVAGLAVVRLLTSEMSFGSVQAVLIGWFAGAAALVALGAPTRRPSADSIAAGLGAVGLALRRIDPASVDARGSTPYFAVTDHGEHLFVKALGQDERSADLLFRLYRWAARHDLGDERPFSSLRRAVEHEALVALAARDLGIRTPRLRAVATAEPASFVLAYDAVDGRSLDRVTNDELTDEVLTTIWQLLGDLRRHRIAHRDLRLANLFVGADGTVWLIDFGFAELAASDLLLANDVAELVASSAAVVGAERAVAPAIGSVDAATRAAAAERLQPWALSGATRTALKGRPGLLDELRRRLGAP
jgi:undecaprenyl-diphosphatase